MDDDNNKNDDHLTLSESDSLSPWLIGNTPMKLRPYSAIENRLLWLWLPLLFLLDNRYNWPNMAPGKQSWHLSTEHGIGGSKLDKGCYSRFRLCTPSCACDKIVTMTNYHIIICHQFATTLDHYLFNILLSRETPTVSWILIIFLLTVKRSHFIYCTDSFLAGGGSGCLWRTVRPCEWWVD